MVIDRMGMKRMRDREERGGEREREIHTLDEHGAIIFRGEGRGSGGGTRGTRACTEDESNLSI